MDANGFRILSGAGLAQQDRRRRSSTRLKGPGGRPAAGYSEPRNGSPRAHSSKPRAAARENHSSPARHSSGNNRVSAQVNAPIRPFMSMFQCEMPKPLVRPMTAAGRVSSRKRGRVWPPETDNHFLLLAAHNRIGITTYRHSSDPLGVNNVLEFESITDIWTCSPSITPRTSSK